MITTPIAKKKRVAIVGATGIAGQQFVVCLENHPWFEITGLAASARNAGRSYRDALKQANGSMGWWCGALPADRLLDMIVLDGNALDPRDYDVVFTAVESDAAKEIEPRLAEHVPVFSTANACRMESDVPLLIPGVNDDHLDLVAHQQRTRGWKGFVLPIPNCTTTGLAVALAPLHRAFGLKLVVMTSMQAVSGAGRNGGVLSLDVVDNLIPYIPKEEEKVQKETQKILGTLSGNAIVPGAFGVTCTCTRIAVLDGHTETVLATFERPVSVAAAREVMAGFGKNLAHLPTAPTSLIAIHDDPFRPQPRLDRDLEQGMVTSVGRLRVDPVFDNGLKFVLVSHNTRMGAARGATLLAEVALERGLF